MFSTVFKDDDDVIIGKVFMQVSEAAGRKRALFIKLLKTRPYMQKQFATNPNL